LNTCNAGPIQTAEKDGPKGRIRRDNREKSSDAPEGPFCTRPSGRKAWTRRGKDGTTGNSIAGKKSEVSRQGKNKVLQKRTLKRDQVLGGR